MRTALTLARKHDATDFEVVKGTGASIEEHARDFKKLRAGKREHAVYAEVQIWTSDFGITNRAKFVKSATKPAKKPEPAK